MKANFTGLMLVTGESAPNVENEILETLSPFVIEILDNQSMDIRGRYFLAIHFSLDKAHAKAIENDLQNTAERLGLDLIVDYQ
jgi:predicted amino acid-binding ACT domain protein